MLSLAEKAGSFTRRHSLHIPAQWSLFVVLRALTPNVWQISWLEHLHLWARYTFEEVSFNSTTYWTWLGRRARIWKSPFLGNDHEISLLLTNFLIRTPTFMSYIYFWGSILHRLAKRDSGGEHAMQHLEKSIFRKDHEMSLLFLTKILFCYGSKSSIAQSILAFLFSLYLQR